MFKSVIQSECVKIKKKRIISFQNEFSHKGLDKLWAIKILHMM